MAENPQTGPPEVERNDFVERADHNTRARHWFFTINNPTDEDTHALQTYDELSYALWQTEAGENNTIHLQGMFGTKKQLRFNNVKNLFPRAHLEVTRNTGAAIHYVTKQRTRVSGPFIRGTLPKQTQGKRTDLNKVKEAILAGASMKDLSLDHFEPTLKYFRGMQSIVMLHQKGRDFVTKVYIFWGPTGSGKTLAATTFPNPYKVHSISKGGQLWFDGYDPSTHETVIFDDYYGGIRWTELLQITDRYPHPVQSKGGMLQFRAKYIVFTSNNRPESWYPKMDFEPFKRRLLNGGCIHVPRLGIYEVEYGSLPEHLASLSPPNSPHHSESE